MLEKQEQEYGLDYINYCVATKMFNELVAFAFADDDAKRGLIKTYLNDIVLPFNQQNLSVYEEKVDAVSGGVTKILDYIK